MRAYVCVNESVCVCLIACVFGYVCVWLCVGRIETTVSLADENSRAFLFFSSLRRSGKGNFSLHHTSGHVFNGNINPNRVLIPRFLEAPIVFFFPFFHLFFLSFCFFILSSCTLLISSFEKM